MKKINQKLKRDLHIIEEPSVTMAETQQTVHVKRTKEAQKVQDGIVSHDKDYKSIETAFWRRMMRS